MILTRDEIVYGLGQNTDEKLRTFYKRWRHIIYDQPEQYKRQAIIFWVRHGTVRYWRINAKGEHVPWREKY